MTDSAPRKFGFDTVFDSAGDVAFAAQRPKRLYAADEVEAIRQRAFAEGQADAMTTMEAVQAQALDSIAAACQQALPKLAEVAHEHRVGSAELALACARAIADAALLRFPHAPIQSALEVLAREIEAAPRLIVNVAPELAEKLQPLLEETAQAISYSGAIVIRAQPGLKPGAFTLDFGDGSATFDPDEAAARVAAALDAAVASEGLHAESLIPAGES
jgi:flagellar assembly protein FliH